MPEKARVPELTDRVNTLQPVDEIARRAHQIYEERGRQDGFDIEDWLRAEREVTQQTRRSA